MPASNSEEKPKIETIFREAASLIFHKEMLPAFLISKMSPEAAFKISQPEALDEWAKGMAELYENSRAYREYISKIFEHSISGLTEEIKPEALGEWRTDKTQRTLVSSQRFLLDNQSDPKWITLIHFCISRALATTARNGFESNEWSEGTMFFMQLDRAFSTGECKQFGRMLANEMSKYYDKDALPRMIGQNIGIGLIHMVALDADAKLFQGIGAMPHH
jgi:hypothetical protein